MKDKLLFKVSVKNVVLIIFFVALNTGLFFTAKNVEMPFWLDTVGTMAAAMELGPAAGVITGLGTSACETLLNGNPYVYSIVAVTVALITGLLMPSPRKRRYDRLFVVSTALLAGLVSAIICMPLNLSFNDGATGNLWGNALKAMLERSVSSQNFNSFAAEAFVDLPDRVVSMFAALALLWLLRPLLDYTGSKDDQSKKGKGGRAAAGAAAVLFALSAVGLPEIQAEAVDFSTDYEAVTYSSKDGIFNSSVNAVTQTPDGFLWVGTYSGLYMYDGIRFIEAHVHEKIWTVKELMVDSRGRLWIGTNDSGVVCFDLSDRSTALYGKEKGLESESIRSICEDNAGNVYVGTALSVSRIDPAGKVKTYSEWKDIINVQSLTALDDGSVAGVSNSGVMFLMKNDMLLYTVTCPETGTDYRYAAKHGDVIYVGTTTSEIDKFTVSDEKLKKTGQLMLPGAEYCNRIRYDDANAGMFYCCEKGCGFIDCATDTCFDMTSPGYNGAVSDVCIDDQGNVWFASSKQGLMKYSKTPFRNLFNLAKLSEDVVNAVMKDGDLIYIGTDNGLYILDLKTNSLADTDAVQMLKGERIRNIFKDSKGSIWISTYSQHGLVRIDPGSKPVCVSAENPDLDGRKFRSVIELSDGRILAATNTGMTFLENGTSTLSLSDSDGLNNHYILSMLEREDGAVLAASDGDGIYIIKNDKVAGHIGAEEGLDTAVVLRIVKCTGGYLYVTSNGIFYDSGENVRRLKNFPYTNNYDIMISENGNCYITSSAGLFIVSEEKLLEDGEYSCTLLNDSWGLNTTFTANSWNIMENGMLYLCCTDGLREISAEDHSRANTDYQLHLEFIEADGTVFSGEDGKWVIPSETRRILINIAVNNFSLSNPRIHYFLDGTDDNGITCYQNEITPLSYTNLSYGKYDLHICVLDNLTGEVLKEEIIPIEKQAVMYEYWYFILYLMFIIFQLVSYLLWVFISFNRRALRIRRLQREISTDPMTGLLNKAGSVKALEKACSEETGVLMMIDLDSFKLVNDIYGHEMGDRILIRFAELITEALGEESIRGRMGGDEFVGFLKNGTEEDTEQAARFLNRELVISAKKFMGEDMNIPIGTSIGAVKVPSDGTDFHELFKLADKALYNVKQNGKHGCSFYRKSAGSENAESACSGELSQIIQIIGERNEGKGAYSVSFDKLQVIYKYLCRSSKLNTSASAIVRFMFNGGEKPSDSILDSFEDHLIVGLKKNDVVSRYNGSLYVLMNDLTSSDAQKVSARLSETWERPSDAGETGVDFELQTIGG